MIKGCDHEEHGIANESLHRIAPDAIFPENCSHLRHGGLGQDVPTNEGPTLAGSACEGLVVRRCSPGSSPFVTVSPISAHPCGLTSVIRPHSVKEEASSGS